MARKVFISVLGTGFYSKCKYVKDDFASSSTRFIQQATLEHLDAANWSSEDTALILLTSKAKTDNWSKTITERMHFTAKESIPYKGLEQVLTDMNLPFPFQAVDIPEGKDETEMWQIFQILFDVLQDGDELYFDLTHSFRYLPMLVLVFGNYAKFLKSAKVKHISYGNYEARCKETDEAPIIDLLSISELQDWTFASADYLENGNVERLITLCNQEIQPILKETKGKNMNAKYLNQFGKYLKQAIEERQTCRGIKIVEAESIKGLKNAISNISEVIIEPLAPIFEKIKISFNDIDENGNVLNGFKAAKWCYDNGLYQQAATIFYENIITYIAMLAGLNWKSKEERECVSVSFRIFADDIKEAEWKIPEKGKGKKELNRNMVKKLLDMEKLKVLAKPYAELGDLRNDFNHSGMRNNASTASSIEKKLKKLMDEIINVI